MSEREDDRMKGMLAEYNSLREERLSLARTSETIDKLFLLVFIAILAASHYASDNSFILFLAGWGIGLSLSYKFKRDQEGMYKIGQYIKVFLEDNHSGFGWQRRQELADKKDEPDNLKDTSKSQKMSVQRLHKKRFDKFITELEKFYKSVCGVIYPTSIAMLFLAWFFTHDVLFKLNWSWLICLPRLLRICGGFFIITVLHFVFVNKLASRKSYDYFRDEWNEKWSKVKAQLDK